MEGSALSAKKQSAEGSQNAETERRSVTMANKIERTIFGRHVG